LFNIASCSKAFLSASLGILIDDFAHGRNGTPLPAGLSTLTWQTKVASILPDAWKLMDPWASEKANLIDILTHVSGLERCDFLFIILLCMHSADLGGQPRLVIQDKFQGGRRNEKSPQFAPQFRAS
jgi:CubicO group peptidase (beta-lactamase class C family)